MENQSHKVSNFWFGFALGSLTAGVASYLLGTKKGRKRLQQILEWSENFEENLVILGEQLEEKVVEEGEKVKEELQKVSNEGTHSTLDKILNTINSLSTSSRRGTKRFEKST